MVLKFQTNKSNSQCFERQMQVDFENKTVLHGFLVFCDGAITISNKDYDELHKKLIESGYKFHVAW